MIHAVKEVPLETFTVRKRDTDEEGRREMLSIVWARSLEKYTLLTVRFLRVKFVPDRESLHGLSLSNAKDQKSNFGT
jgi:hypothetical protein